MRRSNQLVLESAAIASVMIMLTLGGSIATTTVPGSFLPLQNPTTVAPRSDLSGVAGYYNMTLTQLGRGNFADVSYLLSTFGFINVPSDVGATAQAANADLASLNATIPAAQGIFTSAKAAMQADQLMNASALVGAGCARAKAANRTFADFSGPQTLRFGAESVPTDQYAAGEGLVSAEIHGLLGECASVPPQGNVPALVIGSKADSVETGGSVGLSGSIEAKGVGVTGQRVLFFINGSYFGTLVSGVGGMLAGSLEIPFVYYPFAEVQALVSPNSTAGLGGASSNRIYLSILFNQTSIAIGDPPEYLPGASFSVHGNLTTTGGVPLPDAPVTVTYLGDSIPTFTDGGGSFGARFTVPDDASDGVYQVYARFTPRGAYGPSFNFTSIRVYHLGLNLSLSVPGLSWAGFSTHLEGTATSNGTALAGAAITLDSPWGRSAVTTDNEGRFGVSVPVSILEFEFSRSVTLSASPAQPYIASSTVVATLGLFNFLLVVVPAAVIGVGAYEASNLGMFRGRLVRRRQEEATTMAPPGGATPWVLQSHGGSEPLDLFSRALSLASARFSIAFSPSQTIREILLQVRAKDDGEAYVAFSKVLLAAEDFVYGRRFDSSRVVEAREALRELEVLWS